MKLIEFDLLQEGTVLINPEQVAAVLALPDGGTTIRVVGRTEDIHVEESTGDVWTALEGAS